MAEKTFPAFPVHAQPAILRIWQEAHSKTTNYCRSKGIGDATIFIHRSAFVCWCYDLVLSHYRNDDLVDTHIDVILITITLWLRVTSSLRQWNNTLGVIRIFIHVICSLIHQCKFMASSCSSIVNTQREQVVINVHIALSIWNILRTLAHIFLFLSRSVLKFGSSYNYGCTSGLLDAWIDNEKPGIFTGRRYIPVYNCVDTRVCSCQIAFAPRIHQNRRLTSMLWLACVLCGICSATKQTKHFNIS